MYYEFCLQTRKSYESKCKEAEASKEQAKAAQYAQNALPKDIEKLQVKSQRASQDSQKAGKRRTP